MKFRDLGRFVETHKTRLFLIAIGLLFLATRLYRLTSVPRGLNVDEAGIAFDALCISDYGTDRYGVWHPVYPMNFGSGQSALYTYLTSVCIKIWGFRPFSFRLTAVFGGGIALLFGYLIARETMTKRGGLLLTVLVTLCPYFIMASRWGLDCNLLMGFFTMSVYWLIFAVKKEKLWGYVLAGTSFGITLYTYAISYMILPLFLFISFLYLLWSRRIHLKQAAVFVIPLGLLALPLLMFLAVNLGLLEPFSNFLFSAVKMDSIRTDEISLGNIAHNLYLFKELLTTDHLPFNSFGEYGTLYYISVPFLFMGIGISLYRVGKSLRARVYDSQTFVAAMLWAAAFVSLVLKYPDISTSNAIYFPAAYMVALAFDFILERGGRWGKGIFAGICGAYLVCFIFFGSYYYFQYGEDVYPQKYFDDSLSPILDLIESEYPRGTERYIYVDKTDGIVAQPYIYTLVRKPITPEEFMDSRWGPENNYGHYRFYLPEEIDMDGIYVMYSYGEVTDRLVQAGFQAEPVGCAVIYSR